MVKSLKALTAKIVAENFTKHIVTPYFYTCSQTMKSYLKKKLKTKNSTLNIPKEVQELIINNIPTKPV